MSCSFPVENHEFRPKTLKSKLLVQRYKEISTKSRQIQPNLSLDNKTRNQPIPPDTLMRPNSADPTILPSRLQVMFSPSKVVRLSLGLQVGHKPDPDRPMDSPSIRMKIGYARMHDAYKRMNIDKMGSSIVLDYHESKLILNMFLPFQGHQVFI